MQALLVTAFARWHAEACVQALRALAPSRHSKLGTCVQALLVVAFALIDGTLRLVCKPFSHWLLESLAAC